MLSLNLKGRAVRQDTGGNRVLGVGLTTIIQMMAVEERSDRDLGESARRGDKQAFGVLVERHQEAAHRIALRMLSSEEVVRELLQEALLEAYLSLDRMRRQNAFAAGCAGWC